MADELLSCPFCGGEARISRAHQNKMLAMGEVPTDEHYLFTLYHDCANGITICWTYKPKDALIAAWNRRTPPTPATEEREAVARALYDHESPNSALAWEHKPAHFQENVRRYADAALSALAPYRAAEILAAERERDALREALQKTDDFIEHVNLDEQICCSGQDCGCRGSTQRDYLLHDIRAALTANHSAPTS